MALTDKDKKQEEMNVKNETASGNTTNADNSGKLNGVDEATINKMNSTFTASDSQQQAQMKTDEAYNNLEKVTSNKNLVSDSVYNTLKKSFNVPTAVKEADAWLKNQLSVIQSGKTSWSDEVSGMMDKISNREKFSYDVDSDPLFQQALASAMNSGKQAMQDTIGQASALTGGYGSTYATSAGNQAYNSFIEDAYNNLPQYYQMAMEAYQMEGDELYRQLDMYNAADDREYGRNVTAYDATYQHRNQMYNEAYQLHRDAKTDAYNMANLQLAEHGQLVSDATALYNASSDYSDTMYNREYNSWVDSVNQAYQYAGLLNSDYWSQTNFDESVRQYEQNFAEEQRQFDATFAENQRQFDKTYEQNDRHHNDEMGYKWSVYNQNQENWEKEFDEDNRRFNYGIGDFNNDGVVTDEEYAKYTSMYGSDSKEGYYKDKNGNMVKEPTESQHKNALEAYNKGGAAGLNAYVITVPGSVDLDALEDYAVDQGEAWVAEWDDLRSYEKKDGKFVSKDKEGKEIKLSTIDFIKKVNNSSIPKEKKKQILEAYE